MRIVPRVLSAAIAAALIASPAFASELTGTLKKIKDSGTITLGHRDASIPFSYFGDNPQQPVGYSHDLQLKVVEAIKQELGLPELKVRYNLVTSQTRIPLVQNGTVDLEQQGKAGQFRSDLYYRLNVVSLALPPLRERREDIGLLFEHFLQLAALRFDRPALALDRQTLTRLMAHDWPGNVRELRNVAERFALGLPVFKGSELSSASSPSFAEAVEAFERSLLSDTLGRHAGNLSQAAQALGMAKTTLFDKVKKYGLQA